MEKDISKGYLKYEKNLKNTSYVFFGIICFLLFLFTFFVPYLSCDVGKETIHYSVFKGFLNSFNLSSGAVGHLEIPTLLVLAIIILYAVSVFLSIIVELLWMMKKKQNFVCGIDLKYAYSKQGRNCLTNNGSFLDADTITSQAFYEGKRNFGRIFDLHGNETSLAKVIGIMSLIVTAVILLFLMFIYCEMQRYVSVGVKLEEVCMAELIEKFGENSQELKSACANLFLANINSFYILIWFGFFYVDFFLMIKTSKEKLERNRDRLTIMCVVSEIMAEDRVEELRLELQALQSQIQAQTEVKIIEAQAPVIEQSVANKETETTPKRARKPATTSQTKSDK